jgi:hypothetical protein
MAGKAKGKDKHNADGSGREGAKGKDQALLVRRDEAGIKPGRSGRAQRNPSYDWGYRCGFFIDLPGFI